MGWCRFSVRAVGSYTSVCAVFQYWIWDCSVLLWWIESLQWKGDDNRACWHLTPHLKGFFVEILRHLWLGCLRPEQLITHFAVPIQYVHISNVLLLSHVWATGAAYKPLMLIQSQLQLVWCVFDICKCVHRDFYRFYHVLARCWLGLNSPVSMRCIWKLYFPPQL